jgi:hypothetical protein
VHTFVCECHSQKTVCHSTVTEEDTVGALHLWRLAIYSCGSDHQAVHPDIVITNLAASDAKLVVPGSPVLRIL